MRIDADGNLVLAVAGGELVQRAPRIYQEVNGTRRPVAGGYRLLSVDEKAERLTDAPEPDSTVGFRLAAYDGARSLVIDPLVEYSTYLGGSVSDFAESIALDASGNVYVAGDTSSLDFPTVNALYPNYAGGIGMPSSPGLPTVYTFEVTSFWRTGHRSVPWCWQTADTCSLATGRAPTS